MKEKGVLLLKCGNHRNKRPFVSTANEALFGTLVTSTVASLSNRDGDVDKHVINLHI